MRSFKIQTLRDNTTTGILSTVSAGANVIPVVGQAISIVTAAAALFSGIFGGTSSNQLTQANWNTLIPFSGPTYNQLKSYMMPRIKWVSDLGNFRVFVLYGLYSLGMDNGQASLQAAEVALRNERIASGMAYLPVPTIPPTNPNLTWSHAPWEDDFINNFDNYFYGSPADASLNKQNIINAPVNPNTGLPNVPLPNQAGFGTIGMIALAGIALAMFAGGKRAR